MVKEEFMKLWVMWFIAVWQLRYGFSYSTTFMWFVVALMGITMRTDLYGVTSIIRTLGIDEKYYDNLLDFFHSKAVKLEKLTVLWKCLVFKLFKPVMIDGRPVLAGDEIKVGKEGKKMPAVKYLHQESDSNNKAEYIMGHSCQALGLIVPAMETFFCVPLTCRIHGGLVFSNRDKRTLLDKMIILLESLGIDEPCYVVVDAYYGSRKMIDGVRKNGHDLITRMKRSAAAYFPAPEITGKRGRGRPRKYGKPVKLKNFLKQTDKMVEVDSPVYGEKNVKIRYMEINLLWKPICDFVKFVIVVHPKRGNFILMTTDLALSGVDVIKAYGLRFKIEVTFKQALRTLGTFAYHFWSKHMKPIKRKSGNQYLHRETEEYRNAIRRKIGAYHTYIQVCIIAQGLVQYLSATYPQLVWNSFRSWVRTIRPGICPSEFVTVTAMRNAFPEFLAECDEYDDFTKFFTDRLDISRTQGIKLIC